MTQVNLRQEPITEITASGINTDKRSFDIDLIVFATGFDAMTGAIKAVHPITGRDGQSLSEVWANGPQSYLGLTVAGFPNLFLMIGPNATLAHNSMIYMIESHINYIASALAFMARPGVRTVEVKRGVQRRYNEWLQHRLEHSGGVDGGGGSWYLDHRGRNTTLWPDHTWKFRRLTRRFHPGEYTVRA